MTKTASNPGVVGNIHTLIPISADEKGVLPTELELLQIGMWDSPTHGMFMVTPEDLDEYIEHYDADIRPSSSTHGLPIDFRHDREGPAAAWIKKTYLGPSSAEDGTQSLWGQIKWSDQGALEVQGGRWKFFSPEFCPRGRGGFLDPEGVYYDIENVLMGGGLTNRPLFKGLKPAVAASESGSAKGKRMLYISASEKEQKMNLKDLLAKDHNEWTEAERQFVADNKAELTAEQKTKFGFEEKPAEKPKEDAPAPTPPADPAKPVEASEGAQTATISASELKSLQETAAQYRREKAEGVVDEHVKRGAIKQDQAEKWTTTLLASEGDARKNLEAMLTALPGSAIIASENGTDKDAAKSTTSALDELDTKAKGIVSASEGKVSLGDAYKQAQDQDTDLRDRVNKERSANQAVA